MKKQINKAIAAFAVGEVFKSVSCQVLITKGEAPEVRLFSNDQLIGSWKQDGDIFLLPIIKGRGNDGRALLRQAWECFPQAKNL